MRYIWKEKVFTEEEQLISIDLQLNPNELQVGQRYLIEERRDHSLRYAIEEIYNNFYLSSFYEALGIEELRVEVSCDYSFEIVYFCQDLGSNDGLRGSQAKKTIREFARLLNSECLDILQKNLSAS